MDTATSARRSARALAMRKAIRHHRGWPPIGEDRTREAEGSARRVGEHEMAGLPRVLLRTDAGPGARDLLG